MGVTPPQFLLGGGELPHKTKGGELTANDFARRAPRRSIEKVDNTIVDPAVTQAVVETILHTADESETLVRTIVDLNVLAILDPLAVFSFNIQVAPKGTIVSTPSTAQSLDRRQTTEDILNGMTNTGGIIAAAPGHRRFQIDSSGMRKLKRGDKIVMQTTSNPTLSHAICGTIKLFFKE